MTDPVFYSFEDTDALLASLSNSSLPTLSQSDIEISSSSAKTSSYGVSPEEMFFQEDDDWNKPSNDVDIYSNGEFTGFDIDEKKAFQSPVYSDSISPSSLISPSNRLERNYTINEIEEGEEQEDEDAEEEGDDADDLLKNFSKPMKKEASDSTLSSARTSNNKVVKPKKDRSSHNIIEKKYRTNINSKITALRDSVPTLRVAAGDTNTSMDDLEGLSPPSKVNKASVLTKATEYIKHLERKNASLVSENEHLRELLRTLAPQQPQIFPQQFGINPPPPPPQLQQQVPIPPQHQGFQQSGQFQPATDINGQPLNIVSQQNPYQMGLSGKILMGGLTTLVGTNLLNGGADYDYRGLSAFPLLSSPQFHVLLDVVRFSFISLSLLYIFVPSIFNVFEAESTDSATGKECESVKLGEWYQLLKELVFINAGDQKKSEPSDVEINQMINSSIIQPSREKQPWNYLYILLKLHTYKPSLEVSFGKVVIAKLLLAYSDLSSLLNILPSVIQNSLNEIANQKVTDTNLRYLFKDLKSSANGDSEVFRRLLNLSLGLEINTNCDRGINDKGYELILHDERVAYDYKQLLSSLRANEFFREVLLEYIDLTFNNSNLAKLDDDELKETKKDLWTKLSLAESLAPKRSIVDIRIKLFKSILNEKYLDSTLRLINEESKSLIIKEELNGAIDDKEIKKGVEKVVSDRDSIIKSFDNSVVHEAEEGDSFELDDILEEEEEYDSEDDEEDEKEDKPLEKSDSPTPSYDSNSSICTLKPTFQRLLSQDLFNALVSSSILKYSRSHHRLETSKLLKYIKLNRNEITLLSFIAMFRLVQKFPKSWLKDGADVEEELGIGADSETIERIVAELRIWIGDSNNVNLRDLKDDGLRLKREISDKLVEVGKSFDYYEA